MDDEINEATLELGNLNMATVSQKGGYSRQSESENGERHAKDVDVENGGTRCIVPK